MVLDRRPEGLLNCLVCILLVICVPDMAFPQEANSGEFHSGGSSPTGESQGAMEQRGIQWTFDLAALMLSPGMAWPVGSNWRVGWGIGVGDDVLGFMAVGGNHYSEPGWWSYEDRDGATDKGLFDLLHAKVFARVEPMAKWHLDIGLHGSIFIHSDSSDDDFGGGSSVTAYVLPMYGWRHVKFGPRLAAGYFWGCGGASEFGVKVSPLILRVSFG